MSGEDFWAGLGTALSTIIAVLSWLYSIAIVNTLFTFLVGAFVTYLVQSKLQDRSERKKLRVKYIEKFHIPMFLEVEKTKDFLLDPTTAATGAWHLLVKQPEMFTLEQKFRKQLVDFFKKARDISEKLPTIRSIVADISYRNVEEQFFPALVKEGLAKKEGKKFKIDRWKERTGLGVQVKNPIYTYEAPITNCAILGLNPVQFLEEEHEAFRMDKPLVFIKTHHYERKSEKYEETNYSIPIAKVATSFLDFWEKTVEEVQKDADVNRFNRIREELIPIADNILSRLKEHIEKYVITEKI